MAKKKSKRRNAESTYTADSIQSLEGAEAVRQVPGMYIPDTGEDGIHHLVWEVMNNSIDEHLVGHCNSLAVSVDTRKNTVTVKDNGRGIPVEVKEETGEPTIVSAFTRLHTGGKFGKQAYAVCFVGKTKVRLLDGTLRSLKWLTKRQK